MKYIALVFNVIALAYMVFCLFAYGWPEHTGGQLIVLLVAAGILVNIVVIKNVGKEASAFSSWVSLVLERKRLEEQAKVAALRQQIDQSPSAGG